VKITLIQVKPTAYHVSTKEQVREAVIIDISGCNSSAGIDVHIRIYIVLLVFIDLIVEMDARLTGRQMFKNTRLFLLAGNEQAQNNKMPYF
jgi:hypothetical protein